MRPCPKISSLGVPSFRVPSFGTDGMWDPQVFTVGLVVSSPLVSCLTQAAYFRTINLKHIPLSLQAPAVPFPPGLHPPGRHHCRSPAQQVGLPGDPPTHRTPPSARGRDAPPGSGAAGRREECPGDGPGWSSAGRAGDWGGDCVGRTGDWGSDHHGGNCDRCVIWMKIR